MKKLIKLTMLIIMIISVMFSYNAEASEKYTNANELQIYMRQNFTYQQDSVVDPYFDYFQLPCILEFSKMGDCDDFATYSWYYLNEMGIKATRYVLWGRTRKSENYGHAITVFLDTDNTYSIFSNQYVFKTLKTDPVEAIKDLYKSWKIICEWHPIKYGLVMYSEFRKDIIYCDSKDIKSMALYIIRKTIGDTYDYKKEMYKKEGVLLSR